MPKRFAPIRKPPIDEFTVRPNLDYRRDCEDFDVQRLIDGLDWLPGGRLNMAHEAIDRHAANPVTRDRTAMIWEGKYGEREDYTFAQMKRQSDRFANVLLSLGIGTGDHVFILLDCVPELYFAFFGILKVGGVVGLPGQHPPPDGEQTEAGVPSYAADPERVKAALQDVNAKVLVTQPDHRRGITPIIPELFELQHIVVVNKNGRDPVPLDYQDLSFEEERSKARSRFEIAVTAQDDPAVIHFPFDGSGAAEGVAQEHGAVIRHCATGKWCLDLHDDDMYWCSAAPGSPVGTVDGILAPWTNGVTQLAYEGPLSAPEWYRLIQAHGVTVASATPEVVHMFMEAGDDLPGDFDLSSLRLLASGGGPIDAEAVMWGNEVIGRVIHDSWGQTETGGTLCANYASMDVRPGSVGRPVPGVQMAILDDDFRPVGSGVIGSLAVRPGWPATFPNRTHGDDARGHRFRRGWYITAERGSVDENGYYWLAEDDDQPGHT